MKSVEWVAARGKVNPTLEITGISDGLFTLDMTWQALEICDLVGVSLGKRPFSVMVECDHPLVPSGFGSRENNCHAAAVAFAENLSSIAGIPDFSVRITIRKVLPLAGGLGGSATDASAVIEALDRLLGTGLSTEEKINIGSKVGHDCAFFSSGWAAARGGERRDGRVGIRKISPLPAGTWILLANPGVGVTAREAYSSLMGIWPATGAVQAGITDLYEAALSSGADIEILSLAMGNHLELAPAVKAVRGIERLKGLMNEAGAVNTVMSGSGATVFGVFDDPVAANHAAVRVHDGYPGASVLVTRPASLIVESGELRVES